MLTRRRRWKLLYTSQSAIDDSGTRGQAAWHTSTENGEVGLSEHMGVALDTLGRDGLL
jgi:hypothetical protein